MWLAVVLLVLTRIRQPNVELQQNATTGASMGAGQVAWRRKYKGVSQNQNYFFAQ